MDEELMKLLDYRGVLSALATTSDGLVVAAAGLSSDDAEIVGAAGASLWSSVSELGQESGSFELNEAALHLRQGTELSVVVLTELDVSHDALNPVLTETVESLAAVFN